MPRKIISMNVDSKVYDKFNKLCRDEGWVMSRKIEKFMKELLEDQR
ncbi:MAG: hypothetical protein KJ601_07560 [Nanoarchaeota archaeon]|nr:hypothetical protein [Nanoarchaeota archaeon]